MTRNTGLRWRTLPYRLLRRVALPPWLHWLAARAVNDNFLLGVMGIIQDDAGLYLLFRHTYRRAAWGFPAGWMIRGESPLAALAREVREESGLRIEPLRLLAIGVNADRAKMEFVVRGRLAGGEFRPSAEVSAMQWYAAAELPLTGRYQPVLEQLARLAPGEVGYYDTTWRSERASDR